MQRPTLKDFRLRNVQDALKVFYACHLGILPLISRRLDNEERQALRPGDAYVWEGRNPQTDVSGLGIERWTEGKKWSQSRVREDLLYYYEKFPDGKAPHGSDRLIRQTYSAIVNDPAGGKPRKLGLSTYYTERSLERLRTVDNIPELSDLIVPEGLFVRERKSTQRPKHALFPSFDQKSSSSGPSRRHGESHGHSVPRTYAPYPAPTISSTPPRSFEDPPSYSAIASPYSTPGERPLPSAPPTPPNCQRAQLYWASDNAQLPASYGVSSGASSLTYSYLPSTYYSSHHVKDAYSSSSSSGPGSVYGEEPSPVDPVNHTHTSLLRRRTSVPGVEGEHVWHGSSPSTAFSVTSVSIPRGTSSEAETMGGGERGSAAESVSLAPLSVLRRDNNYRRDPADDWALRLLDQKQDCT